jgi:hypothetical protein
MPRWLPPLIAAVLGLTVGLVYGWLIDPVEYVDTTPDTLRADYRADYVLMVAEAYQTGRDPDLAARRLAVWGSQPPAEIADEGIEFARQFGFEDTDIALMQKLAAAMLAWQPVPDSGAAP